MGLKLSDALQRAKWTPRTAEELVRRSGVSRATVYRLLAGDENPTHNTVTKLEAALGLKRGTLVFGHDEVSAR